jgi:hypothetical protein
MPTGKGGKGSSGRTTTKKAAGKKTLRPEGPGMVPGFTRPAKKAAGKKTLYNAKGQLKERPAKRGR